MFPKQRKPTVSLEDDPIKKAKHKSYKDVMAFARGEMGKKLKDRLAGHPGRVTQTVSGRDDDQDGTDAQAESVQDDLDGVMKGKHGQPQMDDGLAEHVGLGEKEEPLDGAELEEHSGPPHPLSPEKPVHHVGLGAKDAGGTKPSLLDDLQDHELKALLKRKK